MITGLAFFNDCKGQVFWVLAPHPDDEVFGCGGTLALLAEAGAQVIVDVISDGAYGEFGREPERRIVESQAAAAVLGYPPPEFWGLPDQGLRFGDLLITRLQARFLQLRPAGVFMPSVWEVHPDHQAVAAAAREAIRLSGVPTEILMYEIGQALRPNCHVDISAVWEKKSAAMTCFASQLRVQSYDRQIQGLNTYRTYFLPREAVAAEAFHRLAPLQLTIGGSALLSLLDAPVARPLQVSALVSVLIRSRGRQELSEALRSVAAQTYGNIEICVLNVTGKTHPALPEALGCVPLRLLEPGCALGRSAAANALLDAARGDFALFLDDDDWLLPSHIATLAGALAQHPAAVVAYGDTVCSEQDAAGNWHELRRFTGEVQREALPFENRLPIHAVLFRRAAVTSARFDPAFDLFEDWDWWLQLALLGEFVHVPGVGAVYRIHAEGGQGVRADAVKARAALEQVVRKWHLAGPLDAAVDRLAYVRQVMAALASEQATSTALRQAHDDLQRSLQETQRQYEAALSLRDREIATQLDVLSQLLPVHAQLSSLRSDHQETEARLKAVEAEKEVLICERDQACQALADIRHSRSWRVTAPLRAVMRQLRPSGTVLAAPRPVLARCLQSLRQSALARRVYYRLPESLRFRLRSRLGRHLSERSSVLLPGTPEPPPEVKTGTDILQIHPVLVEVERSVPQPEISVIIPCFNQGHFLADAVGSVLAAYDGPLDIIIVDDGSSAPLTLRCIEDIRQIYPAVRVIRQPNGGLSSARNAGLDAARGDYVQFLDADDLLIPGKLSVQIRHMHQSGCQVSLCNYLVVSADLTSYAKLEETIAAPASFELADFLFRWERGLSIPIHCGLFSRQALGAIRFNTALQAKEDWVFWCSLAEQAPVFAYLDVHGAIYRMHEGSMRRSFVRMGRQWMQATAHLDARFGERFPEFFDASIAWLKKYYMSHPIYMDEMNQHRGRA